MMNYDEFKIEVTEKFILFVPEEYREYKVEVRSLEKINKKVDGITLVDPDSVKRVSPTIYINNLYDEYMSTGDFDSVMRSAAATSVEAMDQADRFKGLINTDDAKSRIVFQLINTEQNKELLEGVPNREFNDLSIVYRWLVSNDEKGMASILISDFLANEIGMTEKELYKAAAVNTRKLLPPTVKTMTEVFREMMMSDGMPVEMIEMMEAEMPSERQLYVISNTSNTNGAVSMLYEDKLHALAKKLGTDLYILPSSLHEVLAVSTEMGDPYELANMVSEVNATQVSLEDRLSNQVYHYDKDLRKVTMATDTPNKRLDGAVAEQKQTYTAKEQAR